jgi:predicted neutral ceramidase superfamily lipid hydrolase
MLSLAPKGMEDVPQDMQKELESHAASLGMDLMLVDCHNAMGGHIGEQDRRDLVEAALACLDEAGKSAQSEFSIGFASMEDVQHGFSGSPELGQAGLAVMAITTLGRLEQHGQRAARQNNRKDKRRHCAGAVLV